MKRFDQLEDLLENSDIISFNAPSNKLTKKMINREFISKMKMGSSFVNTARGDVIENIDEFYEPLKKGIINSIAFDVLPEEPPGESKIIKAWRNRENWIDGRVIINPHTSYYSKESFIEMRTKAALNVKRIIDGKVPYNIINNL